MSLPSLSHALTTPVAPRPATHAGTVWVRRVTGWLLACCFGLLLALAPHAAPALPGAAAASLLVAPDLGRMQADPAVSAPSLNLPGAVPHSASVADAPRHRPVPVLPAPAGLDEADSTEEMPGAPPRDATRCRAPSPAIEPVHYRSTGARRSERPPSA